MWTSVCLILLVSFASALVNFHTSTWQGILSGGSGVLQSLRPTADSSFDFSPSDYFHYRNGTGNYHTGDITLRWRSQGASKWNEIDTAASRKTAPQSAPASGVILRSTYNNVFPDASKSLNITRDWLVEGNDLVLRATLTALAPIEIGAFGFPIEFNNIFTNRTADDTNAKCVLIDPYIGLDAGYVQATRLTGTGPNLVVTPYGSQSRFEGWRFLTEDGSAPLYYQSQVFEGLYAWQTLTKAYAEKEWNATTPWNAPTSALLAKGQSISFALRFGIAQSVSTIEDTVAAAGVPVAVGLPGYILPSDVNGLLYLKSKSKVKAISASPNGQLNIKPKQQSPPGYGLASTSTWTSYTVNSVAGQVGRVRVSIQYEDGKTQTIHYYTTKSGQQTIANLGDFLFSKQWYNDKSDPFHRAPSVISYDYEAHQQVLQEERVWIAGIADEAGSGSFEAAAMKISVQPTAAQVHQLELMVEGSVWGWLQNNNSDHGYPKYTVKRSLFYYDPAVLPSFHYTINSGWNKNDSYAVWRAFDYTHVSALYYGLYRAERSIPGVLTLQKPIWYLLQSYETALAIFANGTDGQPAVGYTDDGIMCESIWLATLLDLQAEGLNAEYQKLLAAMKSRHQIWTTESLPFGSEMAWDSTGQEGVYQWSKVFGDQNTVTKTINSIRGYMPTIPHWGYNGNARRYWDFLYGGKLPRIERMIHHYGSGMNSVPMLKNYRYESDPFSRAALYDLRVGYGGHMGPLSNIEADGFAHQAFHSFPDTLKWDAYSGDYGPGFLGHVVGASSYLVQHPDFGWVVFGGNLVKSYGNSISYQPVDTVRRRTYVAPLSLWVEIDAGAIGQVDYNPGQKTATLKLVPVQGQSAKTAILTFEDTLNKGVKLQTSGLQKKLGGYQVNLGNSVQFGI